MDPQKNPTSPAPYDDGQALSSQDGGQPPFGAPNDGVPQSPQSPSEPAQEVEVDFNQDAQNVAPAMAQPNGAFTPGMPSLTPETPVGVGAANQFQTPPAGADPYGPQSAQQPGQPGAQQFGAPQAYGPQSSAAQGFDPAAVPGAQPQQPFGGQPGVQPQAPDPFAAPQQPGAFPDSGAAPAGFAAQPQVGQPSQPGQSQSAQPIQPFGSPDPAAQQNGFPATTPVTSIKADKKTVMILAGVAVILIIAIAVLILM